MFILINSSFSTFGTCYIARQLYVMLNNLNQYLIDGYTVDYTTPHDFKIFDNEGILVYGDGVHSILHDRSYNGTNPPMSNEGISTFRKIEDIEQRMIIGRDAWYRKEPYLSWPHSDYKFKENWVFQDNDEYSFNKIITDYNDRDLEYFVYGGYFSKHYIDRFKSIIGEDNFKVINIIRHPIVCAVVDVSLLQTLYYPHLTNLFLSNAILQKDPTVSNYRFEDLLKSQKIIFNNINIDLPLLIPYNDYVTEDEMKYLIRPMILENNFTSIDLNDIDAFKEHFTNLKSHYETEATEEGTVYDLSRLPNNIFEELIYDYSDSNTQLTSIYPRNLI